MGIFISSPALKMLAAAATEDLLPKHSAASIEADLLAMHSELRRPLLRYAVSFGLPLQDGEDVVQETFLALFQHLQRGKSQSSIRSWVFRVTHNLARRRRKLDRFEIAITAQEQPVSDHASGPEDEVLFQERHNRLTQVMRALSEKDQACLRLRAEGLRYREIAEVLNISLGSVSNSLARSLERLTRMDER